MLYYCFNESIRYCKYNDELIILDLQRDYYHLFNKEKSDEIDNLLITPVTELSDKNLNSLLNELQSKHIFSSITASRPIKILNNNVTGMPNINWRMDRSTLDQKVPYFVLLKVIKILYETHFRLKFFGINHLINLLNSFTNTYLEDPDEKRLSLYVYALNQASLWYLGKTRCLEWAFSLAYILLKEGLKCEFLIGVQNYPFMAHAWVQIKDRVVFDDQKLPNKMVVILRSPEINIII